MQQRRHAGVMGEGGRGVFALSSFAAGAVDSIRRRAWEQTGEERGDGRGVVHGITQNGCPGLDCK